MNTDTKRFLIKVVLKSENYTNFWKKERKLDGLGSCGVYG